MVSIIGNHRSRFRANIVRRRESNWKFQYHVFDQFVFRLRKVVRHGLSGLAQEALALLLEHLLELFLCGGVGQAFSEVDVVHERREGPADLHRVFREFLTGKTGS